MYSEFMSEKVVKPLLRGHIHQEMFFVALGAAIVLISNTQNLPDALSICVYSLGLFSMFGVSAVYHRINWSVSKRAILRKLDHSAIYIMIAGTFTPIAHLGLPSDSSLKLLIIIWSICSAGVIKSIFFTNLPKFLNAVFCLIAGYMITPYLGELKASVGSEGVVLIILGGVVYSVGAIIYGIKRPNPWPKTFGYHEIFHALVSIAAVMHFIVIYRLVNN
jgi:hemolysin III